MPDLATVIRQYVGAADAHALPGTRGASPAALRSMRRALSSVELVAAGLDHAELCAMDERSRAGLARQIVDAAELPPARLITIEEALRAVAAFTPRAGGPPPPRAAPETRTPTVAMAALGGHVSLWMERLIVIAFVLTAIGLALALL